MGTIVTPQYVRELAAALDVRNAAEWALPFHLASAPLPEGWTYVIAENGHVSFLHDLRPQSPQPGHPLLGQAAQALAHLRSNATSGASVGDGAAGPARFLGPFENLDSPAVEYFYLDVESGAHVPEFECPPESVIAPLPLDVLRLLSATSTSSPNDTAAQQQQQQQHQQQRQQQQRQQQEKEEEEDGGGSQPVSPAPAEPDAGAGASGPQSSRPQSAASTSSRAAAAAAAAASPRPGVAQSKPPSREGSGRSVGTRAAGSGAASTSPSPTPSPPAAAARAARPASAAADTSPQPAQPAAAAAATAAPRSFSGLTATAEYDDDEQEGRAVFRHRDACTTAGHAGSVSEAAASSGGRGASGGGSGSGGRRSDSAVGSSSSGGGGDDGGDGVGESLSRCGSSSGGGEMGAARGGGGRGGAAGGMGLRPPVAPPSGRLTFYGWWFEDIESSDLTFRIDSKPQAGGGLAPRHCTLSYDFATASYIFTMRDPVTPPAPGQPHARVPELTVPGLAGEQVAMVDTGRPADPWDLHLGARLRVLGRQVVLKNSDLATAQWHAGYFRQLCALRDKLSVEVQKYKPRVLRPGLVYDKGDVRLQTGQQLRHVALQVRELLEDLRQYRPAKAESFLAALPIQF